ncbi:MAG: hypothetical protein ACREP9_11945 [Candidatus Dormibacteraceae bacterium]
MQDKVETRPELTRWLKWADQLSGNNPALARQIAQIALHAADAGASDAVASVLGRMSHFPPSEADLRLLEQELDQIQSRLNQFGSEEVNIDENSIRRRSTIDAHLEELLITNLKRVSTTKPVRAPLLTQLLPLIISAFLLGAAGGGLLLHFGFAAALGIVCAALAVVVYYHRSQLAWLPAGCLTLAMISFNRDFHWPVKWITFELIILAAVYLGVAQLMPRTGPALRATVATQLLLCTLLNSSAPLFQGSLLLAAMPLVVWLSWQARRPHWLLLLAPLAIAALYWLVM